MNTRLISITVTLGFGTARFLSELMLDHVHKNLDSYVKRSSFKNGTILY